MLRVNVQLRRADFELNAEFEQRGRITALFGPSGSGKSTLVHIIAGLTTPDRGSVRAGDETLLDLERHVNLPVHRRNVGVMFQDDRLFPHRTVEGNLRYGTRRPAASSSTTTLDFDSIANLLELQPLLPRSVQNLSGGERQRVALGRTLLSNPRLLLLDEPISSLDRRLKQQIIPFIRRVRDHVGIPMLYVSHDLTEVLQLTDHLLLLDAGRVTGHGQWRDLVHQQSALATLRERGLTFVLNATVISEDAAQGLATLNLSAGMHDDPAATLLTVPAAPGLQRGSTIQIAIRPEDVALASQRIEHISIQNQIPGRIAHVSPHAGRMLIEVDAGCPILAEVSARAVASLQLAPGKPVWCLIKSSAVIMLS